MFIEHHLGQACSDKYEKSMLTSKSTDHQRTAVISPVRRASAGVGGLAVQVNVPSGRRPGVHHAGRARSSWLLSTDRRARGRQRGLGHPAACTHRRSAGSCPYFE